MHFSTMSSRPSRGFAIPHFFRCYFLIMLGFGRAFNCSSTEFVFFEPVLPRRMFQVMVHRGEANQAPENTRPALQRCVDDGLEWAEVDVRLTRDHQHILSHGADIIDNNGQAWRIADCSLAELQKLDVGSRFAPRFAGERPLSLAEAFVLCKGHLNLYLDCKAVDPKQLAEEIQGAGMNSQVVVYAVLDQLSQLRSASGGKLAGMSKWRPAFGGVEWAVTNGLAAVEIDPPDLTPTVSQAFARAGVKVEAKVLGEWDKPEVWGRMIAAGANWLQTDLPEELLPVTILSRMTNRPVQMSLHRGANRYTPENTMPAFAKAVRMRADYMEFDVRTSQDGDFFLLHDARLDRTTDGSGPLSELPAEALRKLSAGAKFGQPYAAVRLPTLDEFLGAFAGKIGFYFDAKAIPPESLAEALQRYNIVDQTVVYQNPKYLARLKGLNPNSRGLVPLNNPEEFPKLASDLKPYGVDAKWEILSSDLIARCHAAGVKVFSDSMGAHERIEDYLKAMDWGIDVIQTDHPLRVLRAVELRTAGLTPTSGLPSAGSAVKP
jgi:glycerophosphoryl diester phosphodiesterase